MMLNAFLPITRMRYVFVGSAIGAALPLLAFSAMAWIDGPSAAIEFFRIGSGHSATAALAALLGVVSCRQQNRLRRRIRDLERDEQRLRYEARHDRLTGLPNRAALEWALLRHLAAPDTTSDLAVLLLDLDRFKFVNDTMGHDAGDELLIALSQRLVEVLGETGRLFRLGGDEFVAVVRRVGDRADVEALCRRIETRVGAPFDLSRGRVVSGVSIGVTFAEMGDVGMSQILKRADLALYKAKEAFGSTHFFYTTDMATEALLHIEIERDLARALQDDELFLEYQPIIGVESGAVRSLEALLRWRHPQRGVIAPGVFIPLAEKTGMILAIGRWVVKNACREAAGWPSPTGVGVNVSGDQFKDRGFVAYIKDCLDEAGLAPGRLTIEVTEAVFSVDMEVVCESLTALRAMGVRIALDDFGTGFSSINNLKMFPLDQLKIDRSFAKEMLESQRDADLVDLMQKLSATFQIHTTIEGIETEQQMAFVRTLGISEAQGFLISKPVPACMVGPLLVSHGPFAAMVS
ncbi:GGDEF domain-containing protein [Agrobacterium sp. a22-2]|uniref:putative bifunctional diguanylate cyclase/phosphodiesterase n=1 Tax=Agrobacterium sp. a22-2 TaxID=2283840 RepID=UPI00169776EF|nr:bifunctional diguanylate cyclase/phosphodiesterase [Agrobacterium sp. a22-2]NKN36186.1 GGDEF domain-containing protein [Agrobacterium sp. a22-2]